MRTNTQRASIVLGAIVASAIIGLAVPASAATRVAFSALVPAPAVYNIDTNASVATCHEPDSAARITDAYPSQWIKSLALQTGSASAQVQINLDSRGELLAARIANSSGNALVDEQALVAARGSKYAPEVHNCNSFKRTYFLDIMFDNTTVALPLVSGGQQRHVIR